MKKLLKLILNITIVLGIISSFIWGKQVSGPGILNPGNGPQFWNNGDFWGFICMLVIPAILLIVIILINFKSASKQ